MSTEYFNRTIHILPSSPWNFFQSKPYRRAQSKPQQIQEIEITPCILSDDNAIKLELNNKSCTENRQTIGG
jgi:hypothetical protein